MEQEYPEQEIITSRKIHGERKRFFFDLKRNSRGVVLRIREAQSGGRSNIIMVPVEMLDEFVSAAEEMLLHADF